MAYVKNIRIRGMGDDAVDLATAQASFAQAQANAPEPPISDTAIVALGGMAMVLHVGLIVGAGYILYRIFRKKPTSE